MKSAVTISLVEEARGGPFVLWDGLERSLNLAAELGFDGVEIFAPDPEALPVGPLMRMLAAAGVSLAAVGTGAGWVRQKLQLAAEDAERRTAARNYLRRMIDWGGALGAPAIVGSMQGPAGHTGAPAVAIAYLCEALGEGGHVAASHGVPLLYEPLNRYETRQCCTLAEGVRLLQSLATDNVRLLADLFHMNIEESDIAAAIVAAGPWLGHVHFVDSNRRPVGEGHLDVRAIIAALRKVGYSGYLSAEAFPYPDPESAARQTMRAFRYWTRS